MKISTIVLTLFVAMSIRANAQINAYAKVTAISGTTLSLSNVNQTYHTFNAGDPVIIMQMQDYVTGNNPRNNSNYGNITTIANAGVYEVATIKAVSGLPNSITIVAALSHTYNFGSGASVQIISFRKYGTDYTTTSSITALPWDGNIGGVVAMQASGTLTVAYPITADGAGFRGGSASANYEVNCENTVYASSSSNYGAKGEGIMANSTGFLYGRNALATGAGGGSDDNGGGGGGSNYSTGGQGGAGWTCSATPVGGYGGNSLSAYINASRIFMGGGGGGGQQNNSVGSAGANGGGIIILQATTLKTSCSSNVTISANGSTAANSGNDGAGGGGAGGAIYMSVGSFAVASSCPLNVQGNGGTGGSVTDANSHGGGGGGGQGVVIYAGAQPTSNITTSTVNGNGGANSSGGGASYAANAVGSNGSGIMANGGYVSLPVKLEAFTGQVVKGGVELQWTTAMEKNNDHFELERSAGNNDFVVIGEVKGAGNSDLSLHYSFIDATPNSGMNYYRLKQVDLDGTATYSGVVAIDMQEQATEGFSVFPNPISNAFTVRLTNNTNETYTISLIDLSGKPVFMTTAQTTNGLIPVALGRRPVAGVYIVSVRSATKQMVSKVLVK